MASQFLHRNPKKGERGRGPWEDGLQRYRHLSDSPTPAVGIGPWTAHVGTEVSPETVKIVKKYAKSGEGIGHIVHRIQYTQGQIP